MSDINYLNVFKSSYKFDEKVIEKILEKYKIFIPIVFREKAKNRILVQIDENYRVKSFKRVKYRNEGYFFSGKLFFRESVLNLSALQLKNKNLSLVDKMFDIAEHAVPVPAVKNKKVSFVKKAIFLDRDGVLIEDTGYPKPSDVKFIEEAIELLKIAKKNGFLLLVVSNQAGIGKGILREEEVLEVNRKIYEFYRGEGIIIDDFYYCPYHRDAKFRKYRRDSLLRKPEAGMILKASQEHGVSISDSFMIGDKESDRIRLPYLKFFKFKEELPVIKQNLF